MHIDRRLALVVSAAGSIVMLAGCGALAKAPATTPTSSSAGAPAAICAADPSLCTAPTDTPAPAATADTSLTGPVGTSYTDTDSSGNVMSITLTGVTDPAHSSNVYMVPDNGTRYVSAKFAIKGVSGTSSDDANIEAVVVGNDGQTYQPTFSDVRGCTNFNSGTYSVGPGTTSIGCVVFQVPNAVKVASIQWGGTFGATPAIWTV